MIFNYTLNFYHGTTQNKKLQSDNLLITPCRCCCTTGLLEAECAEQRQQQRRLQDGRSRYFASPTSGELGLGRKCILLFHQNFFTTIKTYFKIEIHCEFSLGNVLNFVDMFRSFLLKMFKMSASCQFCIGRISRPF